MPTPGGGPTRSSAPLRIALIGLLILLASCSGGESSLRLQAQYLGAGAATDDPLTLMPAAGLPTPVPLVSDLGGGSWWRVELAATAAGTEASASGPRVLHFVGAYSARLTLLLPATGERLQRDGYAHRGPAWGSHRQLPILLPADLGSGDAVYLHLRDRSARDLGILLSELDDYLRQSARHKFIVTASCTALLTMALMALMFIRSFGVGAYAYLAVMAAASAGYVMTFSGEAYALPGLSAGAELGRLAPRTFGMLAAASSYVFLIRFLGLDRHQRGTARLLLFLAWAQLATIVASWMEGRDPGPLAATVSNILILISVPVVLTAAWRAYRQGLRAGPYVLWAWTPGLLAMVAWIAVLQGWLPGSIDTAGWAYAGLALQVAVLMLGVADDGSRLRQERDDATDQAWHDPLTGAPNRRALQERLRQLQQAHPDDRGPVSLVFIDIDHFKRINDEFGHSAGDRCLRRLVELVRNRLAPGSMMARYGGEEFVLLLPGLAVDAAVALAEDLRQAVASLPFNVEGRQIAMTASFGAAELIEGEDPESLLQRADKALYRAKQAGRNRVVRWQAG